VYELSQYNLVGLVDLKTTHTTSKKIFENEIDKKKMKLTKKNSFDPTYHLAVILN
jgi:hypothetical protein